MSELISVCIPVYNGEKYLLESLLSVIKQTYQNIEILVVDDCSSDSSLKIVEEICKIDSRIRLIKNVENLGLVGNWNKCLESARGEWIKFQFQDDTMHFECLERMMEVCKNNKVEFAICNRRFIIENDVAVSTRKLFTKDIVHLGIFFSETHLLTTDEVAGIAANHLLNNFLGEPITLLFKKHLVQDFGRFNTDLVQMVDYELALRICLQTGFIFISEQLVGFRVHSSSASGTMNSTDIKVIKNLFIEPLLLFHEYIFNPVYKKLKDKVGFWNLLKIAAFFHFRNKKTYSIPNDLNKYINKKYPGLKWIKLLSLLHSLRP